MFALSSRLLRHLKRPCLQRDHFETKPVATASMKSPQPITKDDRQQQSSDLGAVSSLSRRRFVSKMAGATIWVGLSDALRDFWSTERTLFAEAAELARGAVTVDLHCHPNKL